MPERSSPCNRLARGLALILDMDGVIIHSNPVHRQAWTLYNRSFGLNTDEAMFERMYGKRNDEIVRDYFGAHLSAEEVASHGAAKERLYRQLMAERLPGSLVPGVREFLSLYGGAPKALATNAEAANVAFVLESAGLRPFFQVVVDGNAVGRPKPHPGIYLQAARLLGIKPENCIVFEDSEAGVAASRAAGMRTVGLLTTHARLPGVDLAIEDFLDPELDPWLRSQTPAA